VVILTCHSFHPGVSRTGRQKARPGRVRKESAQRRVLDLRPI